jgi:metal-responsive CopG/Arc/MetJ family transcriptional regulator
MPIKPYTVYLPDDIVKAIETYQKNNYITTRNAAILQLLNQALKQTSNKKKGGNNNG